MKKLVIYFLITVMLVVSLSLTSCSKDPVKVVMEIKDYGNITLELYPEVAPKTVKNFVKYVEEGFYNGQIFYRVVEGGLVQSGDPNGSGKGDSSLKPIYGEFTENGFRNDMKFVRGVIGMARNGADYDSATSLFFICHQDAPYMDRNYASFGKVIEGLDVLDAIATCEKTDEVDINGANATPKVPVVIESAYVVEE